MTPDPEQIQRLGFEAWADNLIVNALENMEALEAREISCDGYRNENESVAVNARKEGGFIHATVRAYVEGQGWKVHERTIKLKGGAS